ncbi:MAG TPA: DUF1080 domain-containing protein [Planctomycetota bacterium]|nr:DUF1080 domain-containing protein [Planctomycetota bacterium]
MMKLSFVLLMLCLGWTTSATAATETIPPKTHPDSTNWDNLFKADLSDAVFPAGVWHAENGILTADKDENIWTKKEFANCIIDLEFKNGPAANSGVLVYCGDMKDWIPNSVEIQILDDYAEKWTKVPKTWLCGGIFGRLAPAKQVVKPAGEWNRMTVTCQGPLISVLLNGEQVASIDMKKWTSAKKNPDGSDIPEWLNKPLAELPTKGHVGLQGKHGGAPIYFRNVKIKALD